MVKKFAITGVGGYIAPRHLQAIKETGNELVAACDPNDSVGILDKYFYDARFFKEFERFDRHLEKLRRQSSGISFMSICSPNYLHDAHIRLALRVGADAICEKPLVSNPWNLDALQELAEEYGHKIYNVLQLRLHPVIKALKEKVILNKKDKKYKVNLTYITSRGKWYLVSWKGDVTRSGGLATNIGVHFFDMLIWIFGKPVNDELHFSTDHTVSGFIELEHAEVTWFLSIDKENLPEKSTGPTYRSITVDGEEIEFSGGFADLHTTVYKDIINGNGFTPEDARPSIDLVYKIRHAKPQMREALLHERLKRIMSEKS